MKTGNIETRPDTENALPFNTSIGSDKMWDIILKEAEESMLENNRILNLAFIY